MEQNYLHLFESQRFSNDCAPACLFILCKYYKIEYTLADSTLLCNTNDSGTSLYNLACAAEFVGFDSCCVKLSLNLLKTHKPFPLITLFNNKHFVIVIEVKNDYIVVSDPLMGIVFYSQKDFLKRWIGYDADNDIQDGVALLLNI